MSEKRCSADVMVDASQITSADDNATVTLNGSVDSNNEKSYVSANKPSWLDLEFSADWTLVGRWHTGEIELHDPL